MVDNAVSEIEFGSVTDFIEATDLHRDEWSPNGLWESPWVFRGQQDASWDLVPNAWRTSTTPELQRLETLKRRAWQDCGHDALNAFGRAGFDVAVERELFFLELYGQARAEFELVLEFIELADKIGHPVPGAEMYKRLAGHTWIPDIQSGGTMSLLPDPNSATALAQHHGVPTRALDWTYNPLVAAYFAAENVESDYGDKKIAIWAVRHDLLNRIIGDAIQLRPCSQFMSVEAPRSENSFLSAQEGLIIYPMRGCAYRADNMQWPCLEDYAGDVASISGETTIKKLTLPASLSGELLRALWLKGVSRGHLMPTYDNVVKALKIKWEWGDY